MAKSNCDTCGMPEDHYGKNTMPLHRVPIDRHTSTTICDDCAATALNSGDLTPYQMGNLPKGLKERRGKR
jgi:hypothetical protein